MRYSPYDIPLINELYNYRNDGNRVISSFSSGEIKVFYCDPTLLEELLLKFRTLINASQSYRINPHQRNYAAICSWFD